MVVGGDMIEKLVCEDENMIEKWILESNEEACNTGEKYLHHKCSKCGRIAMFDTEFEEDFDESIDGEWVSLGLVECGITEYITPYCPYCGSKMDVSEAMLDIHGCGACKNYKASSPNYGFTERCEGCGRYPWSNDDLPIKYEYVGGLVR